MGLASSARVSAKTGQGVDKAFERLILRVYEVEHGEHGEPGSNTGERAAPPKEVPRGIVLTAEKPAAPEQTSECC